MEDAAAVRVDVDGGRKLRSASRRNSMLVRGSIASGEGLIDIGTLSLSESFETGSISPLRGPGMPSSSSSVEADDSAMRHRASMSRRRSSIAGAEALRFGTVSSMTMDHGLSMRHRMSRQESSAASGTTGFASYAEFRKSISRGAPAQLEMTTTTQMATQRREHMPLMEAMDLDRKRQSKRLFDSVPKASGITASVRSARERRRTKASFSMIANLINVDNESMSQTESFQTTRLPLIRSLLKTAPGQRADDALNNLQTLLSSEFPLFHRLPPQQVKALCQSLRYVSLKHPTLVYHQGHLGECAFVVLSGAVSIHSGTSCADNLSNDVDVSLTNGKDKMQRLGDVLGIEASWLTEKFGACLTPEVVMPGYFGEEAIMRQSAPRAASAVARPGTELIVIDRAAFDEKLNVAAKMSFMADSCRDILRVHPPAKRSAKVATKLAEMMTKHPLLQSIPFRDLVAVCMQMELVRTESGVDGHDNDQSGDTRAIFLQNQACIDLLSQTYRVYMVMSGAVSLHVREDLSSRPEPADENSDAGRHSKTEDSEDGRDNGQETRSGTNSSTGMDTATTETTRTTAPRTLLDESEEPSLQLIRETDEDSGDDMEDSDESLAATFELPDVSEGLTIERVGEASAVLHAGSIFGFEALLSDTGESVDRFEYTAVAHRGAVIVCMPISSRGGIRLPPSASSPPSPTSTCFHSRADTMLSMADMITKNPFDDLAPLLRAIHRRRGSLARSASILRRQPGRDRHADEDRYADGDGGYRSDEDNAYVVNALLAHISGFRIIDRCVLNMLAPFLGHARYARGQTILEKLKPTDRYIVVLKGSVSARDNETRTSSPEDGPMHASVYQDPSVVAVYLPGEGLNEEVLHAPPHSTSASTSSTSTTSSSSSSGHTHRIPSFTFVAEEPTEVLVMHKADLDRVRHQRQSELVAERAAIVRNVPHFTSCSDVRLNRFASAITQKTVQRGAVLVREGDAASLGSFFIIKSGECEVSKRRTPDNASRRGMTPQAGSSRSSTLSSSSFQPVSQFPPPLHPTDSLRRLPFARSPRGLVPEFSASATTALARLGNGDFFGDFALATGKPQPSTVTVVSPTATLLMATASDFLRHFTSQTAPTVNTAASSSLGSLSSSSSSSSLQPSSSSSTAAPLASSSSLAVSLSQQQVSASTTGPAAATSAMSVTSTTSEGPMEGLIRSVTTRERWHNEQWTRKLRQLKRLKENERMMKDIMQRPSPLEVVHGIPGGAHLYRVLEPGRDAATRRHKSTVSLTTLATDGVPPGDHTKEHRGAVDRRTPNGGISRASPARRDAFSSALLGPHQSFGRPRTSKESAFHRSLRRTRGDRTSDASGAWRERPQMSVDVRRRPLTSASFAHQDDNDDDEEKCWDEIFGSRSSLWRTPFLPRRHATTTEDGNDDTHGDARDDVHKRSMRVDRFDALEDGCDTKDAVMRPMTSCSSKIFMESFSRLSYSSDTVYTCPGRSTSVMSIPDAAVSASASATARRQAAALMSTFDESSAGRIPVTAHADAVTRTVRHGEVQPRGINLQSLLWVPRAHARMNDDTGFEGRGDLDEDGALPDGDRHATRTGIGQLRDTPSWPSAAASKGIIWRSRSVFDVEYEAYDSENSDNDDGDGYTDRPAEV